MLHVGPTVYGVNHDFCIGATPCESLSESTEEICTLQSNDTQEALRPGGCFLYVLCRADGIHTCLWRTDRGSAELRKTTETRGNSEWRQLTAPAEGHVAQRVAAGGTWHRETARRHNREREREREREERGKRKTKRRAIPNESIGSFGQIACLTES